MGKLPAHGLEPLVDIRVQEGSDGPGIVVAAPIFAAATAGEPEVEKVPGRFQLRGAVRNGDLVIGPASVRPQTALDPAPEQAYRPQSDGGARCRNHGSHCRRIEDAGPVSVLLRLVHHRLLDIWRRALLIGGRTGSSGTWTGPGEAHTNVRTRLRPSQL